jgi:hypothetical protein
MAGVVLGSGLKFPLALAILAAVGFTTAGTIREAYLESRDAAAGLGTFVPRIESLLAAGDATQAQGLARQALSVSQSAAQRRKLWKLLAWAEIGRRDPVFAHDAMLKLAPQDIDVHLLASYLAACNRNEEAVDLLEDARSLGHRSAPTTKLLADLHFRRGDIDAVAALASTDRTLLSDEDRAAIESAVAVARRLPGTGT